MPKKAAGSGKVQNEKLQNASSANSFRCKSHTISSAHAETTTNVSN